jgi:beta-galactosidase
MQKMHLLGAMRLSLLTTLPLLVPVAALAVDAPIPPQIESDQVLSEGKEPWHATLMPYGNQAEALKANRYASSFARSLNGEWKFNYVPRPEQRPVDFYKVDYDVSTWKNISVPSNWQLKGYGTPYYRNNGYTFQRDFPRVMSEPPRRFTAYEERNPVGSYRRNFDVPKGWDGRRVFLNFDGVDAAFFVWVNGQKVGYNANSRNAAEFDITRFLKAGQSNTLAVEVYRYCTGSYVEDQDMWRLSGIFRNVTLWSAPVVHVRDFRVTTDLDAQYRNATLTVAANVHNYTSQNVAARKISVSLYDPQGKPVGTPVVVAVPALAAGAEASVRAQLMVANPAKWTAETPALYTTVLSLSNGKGAPELLSHRVGFREIEIKGRLFCVNGVPIKLKGANRHESNVETGHYVTEANMIEDIKLLKQSNCNHVRTSHYSNDPGWYELCDQYGLYLVAEANVECHGYYGVLDREPRAEKMIVDRNVANVENFKNSPSIIIWSMGNECGGGSNLRAAEKMVRTLDATRPTHYEAFGIGSNNPAGIDSQMYTNVAGLENIALQNDRFTKPMYLCEYAHAMFNSMGSLGEYNDVFDKYPALLGGAIWEWEDQGIWNRRDPKRQYIAYGGGFGEIPNDHYFIHKGVVFSDRSPKPHFPEVRRDYQWIGFAPVDLGKGQIKIKNKYAFINLSEFKGSWSLYEDGKQLQSGALPKLNLAPGKETTLTLPLKPFQMKAGALYTVNAAMALTKDTSWAKAGYNVAEAQMELPNAAPSPTLAVAAMKPVQLVNNGGSVTVSGSGFDLAFNAANGQLTRLAQGGVNVLLPGGGPALHLWRAQHRNDDGYAVGGWDNMGLRQLTSQVVRFETKQISPSQVSVNETIQYTGKSGFSVTHAINYSIYGDGSIVVDNAVIPQGPDIVLARMGVRMLLDKRLGNVDYLARGPMENYSDRKRGSDLGRYASTVAQQMTPYSKPMENGNHEDTHWVALRGGEMPTLLAQSEGAPLQFSALPYRDEDMELPEYSVDLPPSNATVLCLASKSLGVGSSSCGPRPLPQYLVNSNATAFSYGLRLLPATTTDVSEIARRVAAPERVWPALAKRDSRGLIALDAGGNALTYSVDGIAWQPYAQPFAFAQGGQLKVRSTSKTGQTLEGVIPFDAFADRSQWKVTASSFENGEGNPDHVLDGDMNTIWHSKYSPDKAPLPHSLTVDMAAPTSIKAVRVTPRPDGSNGVARDYELYLSLDGQFGAPILKGVLPSDNSVQTLELPSAQTARYLKFVIKSDHSRQDFGSLAEISVVPTLK